MPVSYLRSLTCAAALLLTTGPMAVADGLAGAYLAGRAATYDSDFAAGAKYYTRALVRDLRALERDHVALAEERVGALRPLEGQRLHLDDK